MDIQFPIVLEQPVFRSDAPGTAVISIQSSDDFDFVGLGGLPMHVSGRDSSSANNGSGVRLTNLTGIHGARIRKLCPHCQQIKDLTAFGDGGRTTNEYRDQSNYSDCRSRY